MHQSICTIDAPEFINLQPMDINPLMSECEIKVFYLGENRNKSFISKEVALDMAKTLRGAPIVGYYKDSKEDFADHGEKVIIDGDGVHFSCETRPYGFVAPDAKVWFQKFDEVDAFGNPITREYMMTTGFLWTGQYPECESAVEGEGKQHSMELDPETVKGEWATNYNTNMEFFIINDAIFSKLCILGDDVEPCFEGSKVSQPTVSSTFSLDDNFKNTLYTMMHDLQNALEGGKQMENEFSMEQDNLEKIETVENETITEQVEFVASKKDDEEDKKSEDKADDSSKEDSDKEEKSSDDKKEDDEDKKKKGEFKKQDDVEEEEEKKDDDEKKPSAKHELVEEKETVDAETYAELNTAFEALQAEKDELQNKFSALEEQMKELVSFKQNIENEQKKELLNSFYMLEDADKKEYADNLDKYSYNDIKSALSIICFDKKVNFTAANDEKLAGCTVDIVETAGVSAWIAAVKQNQEN